LYPLWLWAETSGDWGKIERNWKQLRELAAQSPNKMEEDCHNGYLAGLIAYCRIAKRLHDDAALENGLAATRKTMRQRLTYEFAYTRRGLITQVPVGRLYLRAMATPDTRGWPSFGKLRSRHAQAPDGYLRRLPSPDLVFGLERRDNVAKRVSLCLSNDVRRGIFCESANPPRAG
jgi:hypothetical protein